MPGGGFLTLYCKPPPTCCRAPKPESPEVHFLERNLASRWEGVRLPRASGKSPDFPGSSPNFPGSFSATSPEVLSLWSLTAIQRLPGSFPDFPRGSPNFPGGFPDFPGGQPLFLGSLTPSLDSQNLPLNFKVRRMPFWTPGKTAPKDK